jgi:hypothetical protein
VPQHCYIAAHEGRRDRWGRRKAAAGSARPLPPLVYAFEAGRTDHAHELDSPATKLGRLAGRALAELKKRAKEP